MFIMTKSVVCFIISFLISISISFIIIPLLKNLKMRQSLSIYLEKAHQIKKGTPTMGGLIFIISSLLTIILLFIFKKIDFSLNFLIIIITFILYAIVGLIDDLLIVIYKNNKGLTESQKLIMQIIISCIFFYLFMKADNEPLLWIHTLGIKYDIGFLYGLFILFVLTSTSNAVNLTDGLDGLAGGLSLIVFISLGIITYYSSWLEGYTEISLFCFIISGSILGFLLFNVSPAKVFMGDTGSLSLGALMGSIAILTRHEILLIILMFVFVIETISVILQRYYYKLTKKRLFPMAPIHHSFEKKGFEEKDIVKIFWTVGLIFSLISIIYGVIL